VGGSTGSHIPRRIAKCRWPKADNSALNTYRVPSVQGPYASE